MCSMSPPLSLGKSFGKQIPQSFNDPTTAFAIALPTAVDVVASKEMAERNAAMATVDTTASIDDCGVTPPLTRVEPDACHKGSSVVEVVGVLPDGMLLPFVPLEVDPSESLLAIREDSGWIAATLYAVN